MSLIVISTAVYGLALGWWRSVEMPLLGLFGYIPFGIECLVVTDAWMKPREVYW